MNKGDIVNTS